MLRVATRFREACRPGPVWRTCDVLRGREVAVLRDRHRPLRVEPGDRGHREASGGGLRLGPGRQAARARPAGPLEQRAVPPLLAARRRAGDLPPPLPLPGARPPARGSLRGLEPAGAAGLAAAAVDPPRPARQRPDSVAGAAPARLLRAPHAGTGAADVRPPRDGLAAGRPAAGGLP